MIGYPKPKNKKKRRETVKHSVYDEVYERDKGKCRLCGSTCDLQLHHINGRGKDLTNNPRNCIMLCRKCHLEVVHKNQKKYRPILNEKINKRYGDTL